MNTFALYSLTKARCTSVSINGENHGKEVQPAVTLSFKMAVSNDWLVSLSPWLKTALYSRDKSAAQQGELPGTEVSDAPSLRMPELGPLSWTKEYTGLELTVDHGLGGADSNIVVTDCKADNIAIEPAEGGTVEVSFKLKSNTPSEATRGRLTSLIKRDVEILVMPPDVAQEGIDKAPTPPKKAAGKKAAAAPAPDQNPDGTPKNWPFPKDAPSATDKFVEAHGAATH
jgi:hypothetical protein